VAVLGSILDLDMYYPEWWIDQYLYTNNLNMGSSTCHSTSFLSHYSPSLIIRGCTEWERREIYVDCRRADVNSAQIPPWRPTSRRLESDCSRMPSSRSASGALLEPDACGVAALSHALAPPVISRFICFFYGWCLVDRMAPRLFGVHTNVILSSRCSSQSIHGTGHWSAYARLPSFLLQSTEVPFWGACRLEYDRFEEASKYRSINSSQVYGEVSSKIK
jgi:hypothetical protein